MHHTSVYIVYIKLSNQSYGLTILNFVSENIENKFNISILYKILNDKWEIEFQMKPNKTQKHSDHSNETVMVASLKNNFHLMFNSPNCTLRYLKRVVCLSP